MSPRTSTRVPRHSCPFRSTRECVKTHWRKKGGRACCCVWWRLLFRLKRGGREPGAHSGLRWMSSGACCRLFLCVVGAEIRLLYTDYFPKKVSWTRKIFRSTLAHIFAEHGIVFGETLAMSGRHCACVGIHLSSRNYCIVTYTNAAAAFFHGLRGRLFHPFPPHRPAPQLPPGNSP